MVAHFLFPRISFAQYCGKHSIFYCLWWVFTKIDGVSLNLSKELQIEMQFFTFPIIPIILTSSSKMVMWSLSMIHYIRFFPFRCCFLMRHISPWYSSQHLQVILYIQLFIIYLSHEGSTLGRKIQNICTNENNWWTNVHKLFEFVQLSLSHMLF